MITIINDAQLRLYLPNQIAAVKGEISLFDKILPHLESSERWLADVFLSEKCLAQLDGLDAVHPVRSAACAVVAYEALSRSLATLDVVLTPNGLATVGSQNLTPASKIRVDRLVGSFVENRDNAIDALLLSLPNGLPDWLKTAQSRHFGGTLFPTLALAEMVGATSHKWEKYCELRPQVVEVEASLADEYFSPELMATLRSVAIGSHLPSAVYTPLIEGIRAQVVAVLKGGSINSRRMVDLVNYIRQRPEYFPEWHYSDTSKLFSPPKFENKKNAGGYFF